MGCASYYAEANIVCILMLLVILHQLNKDIDRQLSQIIFINEIIAAIFYFASDVLWAYVRFSNIEISATLEYITYAIPFIMISLCSFIWYIYVQAVAKNEIARNPKQLIITAIPLIIVSLLVITSSQTNLVFSIDSVGKFHYEKLYYILMIVPFIYLLGSSIVAYKRLCKKGKYNNYQLNKALTYFPITPIIGGSLQMVLLDTPIICYVITGSLIFVYVRTLQGLITIDPLTQINNRSHMMKYLSRKMRTHEVGLQLFVILIDIDNCKLINEQFGRSEGDKAIVRVADSIKEACSNQRSRFFVARYGGDEFVVIAEVEYKAEANWLADKIKSNVRLGNEKHNSQYTISVTTGLAGYDYSEPITAPALIARAHSSLQKTKSANVI
ncbi:MAG: GGDEF domain-containing protein [Butyrivibrio sp.]|nr:GGDEF domain-containing protein [Butyrivibrio sp.]